MLIPLKEYARKNGLVLVTVQRAARDGRLPAVWDEQHSRWLVDSETPYKLARGRFSSNMRLVARLEAKDEVRLMEVLEARRITLAELVREYVQEGLKRETAV